MFIRFLIEFMIASFETEQKSGGKIVNRILLKMWDEMAVLSFKHLKQNDFIYVSGHLSSYTKNKLDGSCTLYHEVARLTVLELLPTLWKKN